MYLSDLTEYAYRENPNCSTYLFKGVDIVDHAAVFIHITWVSCCSQKMDHWPYHRQ